MPATADIMMGGLNQPYLSLLLSGGLQVPGVGVKRTGQISAASASIEFETSLQGNAQLFPTLNGRALSPMSDRTLFVSIRDSVILMLGIADQPDVWPQQFFPNVFDLQWYSVPGANSYEVRNSADVLLFTVDARNATVGYHVEESPPLQDGAVETFKIRAINSDFGAIGNDALIYVTMFTEPADVPATFTLEVDGTVTIT